MRKLDIFCPSQASTAICLSMEPTPPSSSSSSSISKSNDKMMAGSSSPAIDRYNPIIRDSRRCGTNPVPPPTVTTSSRRHKKKNPKLLIPPKDQNHVDIEREMKKKKKNISINNSNSNSNSNSNTTSRKSWSCTEPGDFISPPGSTRYLLSGKELLNAISDFDQTQTPIPTQTQSSNSEENIENNDINQILCDEKPVTSCISPSPDQVVVLRVSLHCRGCEKKMRKHISRMEGVRSFNIDFAAKKVTVSGKVTALEVLSSISKVKNAQLWAPTISSEFKGTAAASASASAWVSNKTAAAAAAAAGSFVGVVAS